MLEGLLDLLFGGPSGGAVLAIAHSLGFDVVQITNQRVTIHYNCIGAFEVPDRRKIPERDILLETRKGVALSYAPTQIAI